MPPLSSLTDSFSGEELHPKWAASTGGTASFVEDGKGVMTFGPGSPTDHAIGTGYDGGYDPRGSGLAFELVESPVQQGRAEFRIYTQPAFASWVQITNSANSGNLSLWDSEGGTTTTVAYDPDAHRWFYVEHDLETGEHGTWRWWALPADLSGWELLKEQAAFSMPAAACNVVFTARLSAGSSESGRFAIDNVNLAPFLPGGSLPPVVTQVAGPLRPVVWQPDTYTVGRRR